MRRLAHHLAFAARLMAARPWATAVNVGGLALGLAGCLLILSYVRHERGYDRWIAGHDRVFQVQTVKREPGQPISRSQASPFPVRELLKAAFPQIEAISVVRTGPAPVIRGGEPVFVTSASVDPDFFRIVQLPFAHGSAATALADPMSVVLDEREAVKQFGTADVLGRTLTIGAGDGKRDYRIGGVLRDLPSDTSFRLPLVFRNDPADAGRLPAGERGWGAMSQWHYVRLRSATDAEAINAALPAWERRVMPRDDAAQTELKLVPLTHVHLGEAQQAALTPGGDPRTLATFLVIAALTLGMAVTNFVNLATARAARRAREVALRKLFGARRADIAAQLLVEALAVAAVAMLVALTIVELATPWVARATGAGLAVHYLGSGGLLVPALALWLGTGLAGGLYPALHLSRFRPGAVLRTARAGLETVGSARLRGALVFVQFAVAIGLIACTAVIERQTHFIATLDPGFRRDGLIQLDAAWRFAGDDAEYQAARRELLRIPGVVASGRTDLALAATNRSLLSARAPGGPALSIGTYAIDPGYFETLAITPVAGRLPGDTFAADRFRRNGDGEALSSAANIVVNHAAAQAFGFAHDEAAVGRTIRIALGGERMMPATIVGVVGDTRIRTPHDPLEPIVYVYDPSRASQVLVRYAGANPAVVMAGIKAVWRRFEPEIPFQGRFGDDILAETWAAERARGVLFAGFAGLAVTIACLGLYALAAFAAERRTKEIGIRKVLGARVRDIVRLLAWQFSRPVVLANLVAWPVAWWAMRDWLSSFDARIALTPTPFLAAGLMALAIALLTVAGHAVRVARLSPIHALRHE